jgi:hypothetical protein
MSLGTQIVNWGTLLSIMDAIRTYLHFLTTSQWTEEYRILGFIEILSPFIVQTRGEGNVDSLLYFFDTDFSMNSDKLRRKRLNDVLDNLKNTIPSLKTSNVKHTKVEILTEAVTYIKQLKVLKDSLISQAQNPSSPTKKIKRETPPMSSHPNKVE